MYKKDLQSLLSSPKFPNYFLLFGADEYQIEIFVKEILSKFSDANLLSLYFDEYEFSAAKGHLEAASLFAELNILHIKTNKKIPAKEIKILVNLCKNNASNVFIYELLEADAKIIFDIQKIFEPNFVRIFAPGSPNEAINILSYHAQKIGLNITQSALYKIYLLQNESLYLSSSELNKLSTITKNVDESLVDSLVFSLNGISFETFFSNIIALNNIKDDYFSYASDSNFNEIAFINLLYSAFFRLFKINAFVKINGRLDIKEAIGYAPPPTIAKNLQNQALNLSTELFGEIFMILNKVEYDLKTKTGLDTEAYLLSAILSLQNLIAKNRKY